MSNWAGYTCIFHNQNQNSMKTISSVLVLALLFVGVAQAQVYPVKMKARSSSGKTTSSETTFSSGKGDDSQRTTKYAKSKSNSKRKYGKKPLFKFSDYAASALEVISHDDTRQLLRFSETDIEQSYHFTLTDGQESTTVRVSDHFEAKSINLLRNRAALPISVQYVQLGTFKFGGQNWEFFLDDENLINNQNLEVIGYIYGTGHEIAIKRIKRTLIFEENGVEIGRFDSPTFGTAKVTFDPKTTQPEVRLAMSAVVSSLLMKKIVAE